MLTLVIGNADILQVMGPDTNRTSAGGFPIVIVPGVPDDETNVVFGCKLDRLCHMVGRRHIDGIVYIKPGKAPGVLCRERRATVVREVRGHN